MCLYLEGKSVSQTNQKLMDIVAGKLLNHNQPEIEAHTYLFYPSKWLKKGV
jgi:hypothetical protein